MENSFDTEFNKDPAASVISVAATGQLAAKKVYFLTCEPDIDVNKFHESIGIFIANAMRKAKDENYQSIAFPAIGCGGYGCSPDLIARSIINEIDKQLAKYSMFVSLVIQPDRTDIYDEFQKEIKFIQPFSPIKRVSVPIGNGIMEVQMGDITKQEASAKSRILINAKYIFLYIVMYRSM
jgi:hypothetical protein